MLRNNVTKIRLSEQNYIHKRSVNVETWNIGCSSINLKETELKWKLYGETNIYVLKKMWV